MSERNSVILASAGSGKTFELAGRYIGLLGGGTSPDRILALTFTRKAAGEMLARVFKRLLDGATKAQARHDLGVLLGRTLSESESWRLALSLVRRIGSARVQTLDSFMTQAARAVAPDLGLPPRWRVMDDTEQELVVEDALDRLFETVDVQELSAVVERMLGEMPLRPYEAVRAAVARLHEGWIECPEQGRWGVRPEKECYPELVRITAKLMLKEEPRNQRGAVDSRLKKKLEDLTKLVVRGEWRSFLRDTLVKNVLAGECTYYRAPIPESHLSHLALLIDAVRLMAVGELADQSEAAARVASGFDAALQQAKRSRGVVAFDDLSRLLLSGGAAADAEWLAFRLDSKIDHVLLDEFQDTSRSQYQCLEPILAEIVSQGGERSIFAVGDVKQSLYGWRNAVPDLLPSLPRRLHLEPAQTRAKSWRSSPAVLEAVNAVFGTIAENSVLQEYRSAATRWSEFFQRHEAVKADLPGTVRIEEAASIEPTANDDGDDDTDDDESSAAKENAGARERHHIEQVAARVAQIHRDHPDWTIAVLLRTSTNNRLTRYAEALKRLGIDASEDRGFPLTAEPAVNAVLSLLQLAEHPGDSAAGYHVATSALGRLVGLNEPLSSAANGRCAERIRLEIARSGLTAVLRALRLALTARLTELGVSRLVEMERLASQWDADTHATLADFIRTVEQSAVVDAARAKVSVMTIHHAKGLEFDAVVLPELNRAWKKITPKLIVDRGERGESDPLAPVERVTIYPAQELQDADERLRAMAHRYWSRVIREELSCLYVAMTRAVRRLDIMIQPTKNKATQPSAAAVLKAALGDVTSRDAATSGDEGDEGDGRLLSLIEHAGSEASVATASRSDEGERRASPTVRFHLAAADLGAMVAPSAGDEGALSDMLTFELTRGVHLRAGEVWHFAFETIEWCQADSAVRAADLAAAKFRLPEDERTKLAGQLAHCLANNMGGLFVPDRYLARGGGATVLREWSFAIAPDRSAKAMNGRIDRLVVGLDNAGRPLWAEVIDFKVQLVREGAAAAAEEHRAQMEAYRGAVSAMLKLEPAKVSCVVAFPLTGTYEELPCSNPEGPFGR